MLVRRSAVDYRGLGNSPEQRKADCSAAIPAAGDARRVGALVTALVTRCRIMLYWIKAAPYGAAGPASAPGSALGGPPGARRATR